MPRHSETRHLPYTPEQLFDLVADVANYDEFLPWVVAVRIRSSSEEETVADLIVVFARAERGADPSQIVADQKLFEEKDRAGVRRQAALCALELLMP